MAGDSLLAAEVYDGAGHLSGVRPLGGSVAFGETAARAVIREFHEELGITVTIASLPIFIENIYSHAGMTRHEVIAAFDVNFPEGAFAGQEVLIFNDDNAWPARRGGLPSMLWVATTDLRCFLRA